MIRIQRGRLDTNDQPIEPNEAWFARAREATEKAIEEGSSHVIDETVYRHREVRLALEELFYQKCAYCEVQQEGLDVEHFRPKGAVHEDPSHPGYYWLTYTWSNLYPSCPFCNQKRIDYPTWNDRSQGASAGKHTQFPLKNEETRARSPQDDISKEARLLLDPCEDEPIHHLSVNPFTGKLLGLTPQGVASIRVYNLNRKRIQERRATSLRSLYQFLQSRATTSDTALVDESIQTFLLPSAQFAGVCRAFLNDPRVDPYVPVEP